MKFETYKEAALQARIETNRTHCRHFVGKTICFSLEKWEYIACYTLYIK